ncbi:polyribonucleotide nucleotidyltransferase [Sodalis-like secondary symbiont of Drepanosiphum platanoidis]|uniref:polyribonucleotide nucleotidyltransferase n=1 Tax=Sodalis-like secondary symbiont of Drepanosiphum platanoidis TaxID=2994493 RepID=UPI00346443F0
MLRPIVYKFNYDQYTITLETGMIARQASSSIMISMDDTAVFITVVCSKESKDVQNFFPLTVNYQERTYSAGKFPGGFFRREGRPSENEILTSRLIDRSIRPLFPKNFNHELQIIVTLVSLNPKISPDILSIIGVSAALSISGVPFKGPIGAARIGFINDKYILNPTINEMSKSSLDLIVAGTSKAVLMVESESKMLDENNILKAIILGYEKQQTVIKHLKILKNKINKKKLEWNAQEIDKNLETKIHFLAKKSLKKAYKIFNKKDREFKINEIKKEILNNLIEKDNNINEEIILNILNILEKNIVRNRILNNKSRIDGRDHDMIRELDIRIGILPRTHGSALFTRGETQALVTTTLGTERNAQNIDDLTGEKTDRFILHYNFPPYCVGEIGIIGVPKRREIGHGRLAKKSLIPVMPNIEKFPYTVRVVSEITESNGSSSMASVCGASLSLMDAGVPIKYAIAGIAMGLIKDDKKFVILSDIISDEDYLGDMDFKISGSIKGITALQMDIKIEGITFEIIQIALNQAKSARLHILKVMEKAISSPRNKISKFAPRIHTIKINPEKIKDIIGKGGSVIRSLTEETNTTIEIEDNGIIQIAAINNDQARYAIKRIQDIIADIEVNRIYIGKVTKIVDFGAFVSIGNGNKEGLVHISQISNNRIEKVSDYLSLGQSVKVKVLEIDKYGRIRLSMKIINLYKKNNNI